MAERLYSTAAGELFPLSEGQRNIWDLQQAFCGTPINNICSTMNIKGTFSPELLRRALLLTVKSDPSLRMRITLQNGEPMWYTAPYAEESYPLYDFTNTGESGVLSWEDSVSREPMETLDSPLCLFYVFRSAESEGGVLVKLHHIMSDGWSCVLLGNRIADAYLALLKGEEPNIEVSPSFSRHINDESAYLASPMYEKDGEFWREKFADFSSAPAIKRYTGAKISPVGRRVTFRLSEMLSHGISRFCTENRVAPFTVLCMALLIYLKRTSRGEKLSLGVPIYNRTNFRDKKTTGMFVSTMPFVTEPDDSMSFEELNRYIGEQWYDLLRHQKYPFGDIVKAARSENPACGALFNIVLSFQNGRLFHDRDTSVGFSGRWHYSGYQAEHIVIHLSSLGGITDFSVDYDYLTQIYTENDIKSLHGYLTKLIEGGLAEPNKAVKLLPMLSRAEEEKVIFSFNRTERPVFDASVHSALKKTAALHPERAAIVCGGERLSFMEMMKRAERYASAVSATGAKTVCISLEKSFELICAMIGVNMSGGAWAVLPASLPEKRRADIIADSGAGLLIAKNGEGVRLLRPEEAEAYPEGFITGDTAPEGTAYIVYTSGSTGKPKGVMITHKSLLSFARAMMPLYGHGAVLSASNTGFDVFVLETIVSLLNGKTVVLPRLSEENDPAAIASLIMNYGVNTLALTPSRVKAYLRESAFSRAVFGIESFICGGEHLTGEIIREIKKHTAARVYNQYGPSEATIGVSRQLSSEAAKITAGRPMDNCRLYVLDSNMQPLPIGVDGDLYIGGACLARGYCDEALNASAFLPDPFITGERIYKTGDIAHWEQNGEISIAGRADGQIKLRGQRIEPGDITAAVSSFDGITACAAQVIKRGAEDICVYYVSEREISDAQLIGHCAERLPAYMIPRYFMRLDKLPLNSNGKLSVSELPEPQSGRTGRAPVTELQKTVLDIFKAELSHAEMDMDSDYFLCGGDSLSAAVTVCAINEKTGASLKISDLLTLKTAANIALRLGDTEKTEGLARAPRLEGYPLSPLQQSIYFENALRGGIAYNMAGAFLLPDGIDIERLKAALCRVASEEELLHAYFEMNTRGLELRIDESARLEIETAESIDFESAAQRFIRPFDLSKAPLMRAMLLKNDKNTLFIDMHHIISDGLSCGLLMRRIDAAYRGESIKSAYSFLDHSYALSKERLPLSDAWDALPRGSWSTPLTDEKQSKGGKASLTLSQEESESVKSLCAQKGVTLFALCAAAFALTLSRVSLKREIVLGAPFSGRTRAELLDVFGPLINTLPIGANADEALSAEEYLLAVSGSINAALGDQHASTEEIRKKCGVENGGSYNVMITKRPISEKDFTLGGERLSYIPLKNDETKLDLVLEIIEDDSILFEIEYSKKLSRRTAELYLRCIKEAAGALLKGGRLKEIGLLNAEDSFSLVEKDWYNRTPFVDMPLYLQMERRARPEDAAVIFGDKNVTFKELLQKADGIAKNIAAKADGAVGVCMERSALLLSALIGVWKAGKAYVPLTRELPEPILRHMMEKAGIKTVLCEKSDAAFFEGIGVSTLRPELGEGEPPISFAETAQIIFTSGTTGRPKGAVITHRALCSLAGDFERRLGGEKRVLCVSSFMFDTFAMESLLPLAMGKTVVLANEEEALLPWKLAGLISKSGVTAAFMTPSRWRMCAEDDVFKKAMGGLRLVMSGGERLSGALAKKLKSLAPSARVLNFYGPTETTIYVSCADITQREDAPIGTAADNCRLYVLDEGLRPVMPTAAGELYAAGVCVAKGYAGESEKEAAFMSDPFFPGEKMYRTGDTARINSRGEIEFIGRKDGQIKLNGRRMELSDVDGAVMASGLAKGAVTVAKKTNIGTSLICFVIPESGADAGVLKQKLEETLPPYMIPSEIIFKDSFPVTQTGKTDILALVKAAEKGEALPEQKGEGIKADIICAWETALEKKIDEAISFFDQGGTSLAALRVLSEYFKRGHELTLTQFYENPTVAAQAELLGRRTRKSAERRVFITGAGGFLGAHILRETVESGKKAVCLVRSETRLKEALEFYFGSEWVREREGSVETQIGDITAFSQTERDIETIFHCAADVRHYAKEEEIMAANVGGTAAMARLAREKDAALRYISTMSVGGDIIEDDPLKKAVFTENDADIGQNWRGNVYVRSKFKAEELLREEAQKGLNCSVMRIGRLVGRSADGVFQKNRETNSFYNLVRGIRRIGVYPSFCAETRVNLTAVDECARAITLLKDGVFHVYNPSEPTAGEIFGAVCGALQTDFAGFEAAVRALAKSDDSGSAVILLEQLRGAILSSGNITASADSTLAALKAAGFEWKKPDIKILLKEF